MHQVEMDYLQHLVLLGIYSSSGAETMVFKGGTSLQKTGMVRRFSEDLDFTSPADDERLERIVSAVARQLTSFGFQSAYAVEKSGKDVALFKVMVKGPLFLSTQSKNAISSIKIEVSRRESASLRPSTVYVAPVYPDLAQYSVVMMDYNEIAAEKVRAIMTRIKPRDLYDLWVLLTRGYKVDLSLVNKKMAIYQGFHELSGKAFKDAFKKKVMEERQDWGKEMGILIYGQMAIPQYSEVSSFVLSHV